MEKPFERVSLADLRQGRRGKHHEIVGKVLRELKEARPGEALQIPLSALEGVSIGDFRSAINRRALSEDLTISTYSDAQHVYVWIRSRKTGQYERQRSKTGS